jgi:uncharacterized membrane protein YdfJ with MMPL/SSD domain
MDKRVVLYVIVGILILGLLLLTFFPGLIHAFKDSGKTGEDKCLPPPGQTEEEWREHMSHHPNIYSECLS